VRDTLIAWAVAAGILLFGMGAAGRISSGSSLGILRDNRGRYSLSHVQILLWTLVILSLIAGVAAGRLLGDAAGGPLGFTVPDSVLALLGISIGSTVAARAIKAGKNTRRQAHIAASDRRDPPHLAQILLVEEGRQADRLVDVTKVQSLVITIVLVVSYVAMAVSEIRKAGSAAELTSLPDVAGTFGALLAISHAGYLAGKLPDQPGIPEGRVLLDVASPARAQELRKQHPFTPRRTALPEGTVELTTDPQHPSAVNS
jgi:hypothetical protein